MARVKGLWKGEPAVVLASGPSLTQEQIDLCEKSKIKTIAINTTWEKARFCHVIYAGDYGWWKYNSKKIDIDVERYCCWEPASKQFGAVFVPRPIQPSYNSGLNGIHIAYLKKANPILICGFDASVEKGIHHHGPHEKTTNPTQKRCNDWVKQARQLKNICEGTEIINCSIESRLDAFPRRPLEEMLCELGLI